MSSGCLRRAALKRGDKTYTTGQPCKNGHMAARLAINWSCVVCYQDQKKAYRIRNHTKILACERTYEQNNKPKRIARNRVRKNVLRQAEPKWVNKSDIVVIYTEAEARTKETGILHHVDHVVPLKHPSICGLHVPWNLQVITATENLKKSNRFEEN
jgi:hypothetical protein